MEKIISALLVLKIKLANVCNRELVKEEKVVTSASSLIATLWTPSVEGEGIGWDFVSPISVPSQPMACTWFSNVRVIYSTQE